MPWEQQLVLGVSLVTWVAFGVAMRVYFKGARKFTATKALLTLSAVVATASQVAALIWYAPPQPWCWWIAVAMFAAAHLIYWWALLVHGKNRPAFAFLPVQPQGFTDAGPYRRIRHPIYSAYLLGWLAGLVATLQPWLLLPVIWMVFLYYRAARQEERQFASSPVAEAYAAYQRRSGMFIPKVV